ncbi:MMPL family transporter [Nocardioides nitrophenolicus]|uniref:MMPL family transporter n=1 Tax=Nocardioides nitrophenolicus TaxID=60489 RepID=UPI0019582DCA|nr:MMPL family transporter [Nocardioides nitrophenolicus]MBM7518978.1 RND superfamily putative drug exporter [Nocardioides nitrophenolicus]
MHRQIAGRLTGPVTKWIVLVAVIVIAGGLASFAGKLVDVQNNETESWLPESAESTKGFERLEAFQDPYDVGTTVVYYRASGLTDADLADIETQGGEIGKLDGVSDVVTPQAAQAAGVPAPFVSADGKVAKLEFTVNYGDELWEVLPDLKPKIDKIIAIDGVRSYLAGAGGQSADAATIFSSGDSNLLLITLGVVVLILLVTYRSPILWLLPIITAVVGLGASMGVLYLLAKNTSLTVNGQSQFILTVLVIGAGTDYALLLVARYREELRRHEDRHEAMAFALHRAAPAILASSATVVVGLLCLMFADLNSTAGMGPANAVGIAVTFVVMVTLLPALLVICGRWVFWPFVPHFGSTEPTASGLWAKVGAGIAPRPRLVWIGTAAVLGLLCLGFLRLDTGGIPSDEQYTKDQDSVIGQTILVEHGLVDASTPIQVVANADRADDVIAAMSKVEGISAPVAVADKDGIALIVADLTSDPYSDAATAAVEDVRSAVHQVPDADALTTGMTAVSIDIMDASARDNKVIIPIVLGAVLLILAGLLRSILSPVLLIGTVILSFGAALGISGLVFDLLYGREHTDPGFPLFAFVFLVALGIDYNIFLMTRVREEAAIHGTRRGSLIALSSTGGVITSAGLVLAATFAMLATMPMTFTLQLGTTVALGVLLDTMIVRSVLVTALNLDLGGRIWWPSKLDRATPAAEPEAEPDLQTTSV